MPIQFRCPECSKAVEVDAEFALRSAQCPYCSAVISVPAASTLTDAPAPARPATSDAWDAPVTPGPPPPQSPGAGPPPSLHVGPAGDRKQRRGRVLAIISLICGIVGMTAYGAAMVLSVSMALELSHDNPNLATINQENAAELQKQFEQHPLALWVALGSYLGSLSAIVGLACGIVSVRLSPKRNASGWTGTALSGACALCLFSAIVASVIVGGAA